MTTESKFVPPRVDRTNAAILDRKTPENILGATPSPGTDRWIGFGLNFNFISRGWKTGVVAFRELLELLDNVSKLLSSVLRLSEVFVNDFRSTTNMLKVLVRKILGELHGYIRDFENTGAYSLVVLPELNEQNAGYFPLGGGINGFKQKVTQSLFNAKDPNRPDFSDSAYVGGMVFLLTADANDPKAISDLIENLRTLSNFFPGFTGSAQPAPPVNVRATPGFFAGPVLDGVPLVNTLTAPIPSALNINRRLGIKITWEDNPNLSVFNVKQRTTKYYVYRSTARGGTPLGADDNPVGKDGKKASETNLKRTEDGKLIYVFGNDGHTAKDLFNGGQAFKVTNEPFNNHNEMVDFDIVEDREYFYIVVPAFGNVEGPDNLNLNYFDKSGFFAGRFGLPSPVVSAKAIACIPDRMLDWVEYPGGRYLRPREGDGPFWNTVTMRSLMGPQSDRIIKSLADLVNILGASIENSNSSLQDFQRSFAKRIRNYLKIIERLERLAIIIDRYRIHGGQGAIMLNLDLAPGGIKTFSNRFNAAKIPEEIKKINPVSGIAAGVVILFGHPGDAGDAAKNFSKKNEYQFLTDPFSRTQKQVSSEVSPRAMNIIKGLFTASGQD